MNAKANTQALPDGAAIAEDGSIVLRLSESAAIPSRQGWKAEPQTINELVFHRLRGAAWREAQAAKEVTEAVVSKMLRLPVAVTKRIVLAERDNQAVAVIVAQLWGDCRNIPERATRLPNGGRALPLLYPVAGGETIYGELQFRPLPVATIKQLPKPQHDKFMATAIQLSCGLPPRIAWLLADRMDAVDCSSIQAVVGELCAGAVGIRAQSIMRERP